MSTGTPPGEDAMSTTAVAAETLDRENDPPEPGPSTSSEPPPEEEQAEPGAEPEDRRGDVDDLPRTG
jgi:hypothetical protein